MRGFLNRQHLANCKVTLQPIECEAVELKQMAPAAVEVQFD